MAIESSSPSRKAIEDQIARILASPVFAKSDRMSRFLNFISDRTLEGRNEDLKEYTIALEVFDKSEDFDPRIDPTVRSEARRLRAKLAEYYETANGDDKVLIDLPKGAYVPVFTGRELTAEKPSRVRAPYWIAVLAILIVALAAALWWRSRRHEMSARPRSIAVLPFENLSTDPANEPFSDGLTEEILNALANAPGLKVVARTSAFAFKGKHEDIRSIGKKLNVDMVLEGSVRRQGDQVRITPQLINVTDGYHLWSAEYDRSWKDLFAVQREIAESIARMLGTKLGRSALQPADAETYRLYLEARYHFNQWRATGMQRAVELFEQVTVRDPKYAPGYAGLAASYGILTALGGAVSPEESRARSKRAALRAIEIDPTSSEGWSSLAPLLAEEFDWQGAESAFRKALELDPNSAQAHEWYAELYLSPTGRLDEALRESQLGASLDPISPYALMGVGIRYFFLHQYDEALTWGRKAVDLDPHFSLAMPFVLNVYLCKRDLTGGRKFFESVKPQVASAMESQLDAAEGKRTEALKIIDSLGPRAAPCLIAGTYMYLNDRPQAIAWLDRAIEKRSACFEAIPVDPRFDPLHSTPEFAALMRKMKLPVSH